MIKPYYILDIFNLKEEIVVGQIKKGEQIFINEYRNSIQSAVKSVLYCDTIV